MTENVIIFLIGIGIGVVVGGGVVWILAGRKARKIEEETRKQLERTEKERKEEERCAAQSKGLEEYNQKLAERKEKLKSQILQLFDDKKQVTNSDVGEALNIPSRSAVRYLEELEQEGKIRQVGDIGRGVRYETA